MQRRGLGALLAALAAESDLGGDGGRTDLIKYAQAHLSHHVVSAMDSSRSLLEDELLLRGCLSHADETVRRLVASGVGEALIVAAAEEVPAPVWT